MLFETDPLPAHPLPALPLHTSGRYVVDATVSASSSRA
jgi:hypothetical protein